MLLLYMIFIYALAKHTDTLVFASSGSWLILEPGATDVVSNLQLKMQKQGFDKLKTLLSATFLVDLRGLEPLTS